MIYRLVILALTLATVVAQAQTFTCLTYNIRLDVASDGENAWPNRKELLADQIRFYAPDIFGTQEGLPHQMEYLKAQFANYACLGIGREGRDKGESSSIFVSKTAFKVLEEHTFWLSTTPDSISMGWDAACLRVCTYALIQHKKSKQNIWIFNTHLDHMGEQARMNGMDLILRKIAEVNQKKWPVILMGDLNAEPNSTLIAHVERKMKNARKVCMTKPFGPMGTFNGFDFHKPVVKWIDYIFVSDTPGMKVQKFAVLSDSFQCRYPSDHLPVFAEITISRH